MLIGAVIAYLQFTQQQQASRDLLISNQVSKGFEQLAGEKMEMRLGGIYALEGVINTSGQYHGPVLEALCAFVRDHTAIMRPPSATPMTDVQTVLTVIGGRHNPRPYEVNLAGAKIPGADLTVAYLEHANLTETNLEGASLAAAHLEAADLGEGQIDKAFGDAETKLPEGLTRPAHWTDPTAPRP